MESSNRKLESLSVQRANAASSIERCRDAEAQIGELLETMVEEICPDLNGYAILDIDNRLKSAIAKYTDLRNSLDSREFEAYLDAANRIKVLKSVLDERESDLHAARSHLISDSDASLLSEVDGWCSEIDVRRFLESSKRRLEALYSKHGSSPKDNAYHRHQLFVLLTTCVSYYDPKESRDECLSIDEAQDISPAEYYVLRKAMGPKVVFNLYGDLGQRICKYRGLSSWSEIATTITGKKFYLNQNYRNTVQVTDYCNERFGKDIAGVGIDGPLVKELHIQDAIQEIFALRSNNASMRLAMIHKRGLVGFREYFGNFLGKDASWGEVDSSKLSVIDVESSKGLEFDAAIVVVNCMEENEEYIAFTRALGNLFVCRIHGLEEAAASDSILASAVDDRALGNEADDQGQTPEGDGSTSAASPAPAEDGAAGSLDSFDSIFEGMEDFELEVPDMGE